VISFEGPRRTSAGKTATGVSMIERLHSGSKAVPTACDTNLGPDAFPFRWGAPGHRHHDWIGTKGDVVLWSAASVALGSVGRNLHRGSFHVNELALVGGGVVRVTSSERIMVS
jgi:hypothetical protein